MEKGLNPSFCSVKPSSSGVDPSSFGVDPSSSGESSSGSSNSCGLNADNSMIEQLFNHKKDITEKLIKLYARRVFRVSIRMTDPQFKNKIGALDYNRVCKQLLCIRSLYIKNLK